MVRYRQWAPFFIALLALPGCGGSSAPTDTGGGNQGLAPCSGFPPESGEYWQYRVGSGGIFETWTEPVDGLVANRRVQRIRRTGNPEGLGEYVSCDPDRGQIEVAADWWDVSDPSAHGRYFWVPPLFHCRYGDAVGDSCVWAGTFGGGAQREVTRVLGYEDIAVWAGTFKDVMKVRVTTYDDQGNIFDGPVDYWGDRYAGIVRGEEVDTGEYIELMEYMTYAVPGDLLQWNRRFGGTQSAAEISTLATDGAGNTVVAGCFAGSIDLGGGVLRSAGGRDIFLAKFDASGRHLWSKRFGDQYDQCYADLSSRWRAQVAVDPTGNVVLGGELTGLTINFGGTALPMNGHGVFIARFGSSGSHVWSRYFDTDSRFGGVALDTQANIILAGSLVSSWDLGGGDLQDAGQGDMLLAKFGASGDHVWSRRYGDADPQELTAVDVQGSDQIFVTGTFTGTVDLGDGPLTSVTPTVLVSRLGADGVADWSRTYAPPESPLALSVAASAGGGAVASGVTYGGFGSGYVVSFDAAGNSNWHHDLYGGYGFIDIDSKGNTVLAGALSSNVTLGGFVLNTRYGPNVLLASIDSFGEPQWARQYGFWGAQAATAVAIDASDNIVVAGIFEHKLNLGANVMTAAGYSDIFLAKFHGTPQPVPALSTSAISENPVRGRAWIRNSWRSLRPPAGSL